MSELTAVAPGEPIDATTFGNPVIARVISRYADSADRDTKVALPAAGDPAYLVGTGQFQVYDGTAWRNYARLDGATFTGRARFDNGVEIGGGQVNYLQSFPYNLKSVGTSGDVNDVFDFAIVTGFANDSPPGLGALLTVRAQISRAGQIHLAKNTGALSARGIVDNGPVWTPTWWRATGATADSYDALVARILAGPAAGAAAVTAAVDPGEVDDLDIAVFLEHVMDRIEALEA